MPDTSPDARRRVCVLIDALQCAPMTRAALAEEAEMTEQSVTKWLTAFRQAELIEQAGHGAKPRSGATPILWKWKGRA